MSIILQSFVSVASSIDTHNDGIEHLQTVHIHAEINTLEETDQAGHDIKDCHHCGHCSGSHLTWVFTKISTKIATINSPAYSPVLISHPSSYIDATFALLLLN